MARRRITIDVDEALLETVDLLIHETGSSRNRLVAEALAELLRKRARQAVDRQFEQMAQDEPYRQELTRIESEAAGASDAAWRLLDRAEPGTKDAATPARRGTARAAR